MVVRLIREKEWAQQHPDIMGPSNAYLFLGYNDSPGHLAFGNNERKPMANWMKAKGTKYATANLDTTGKGDTDT
jgi:hypothetical protein